MIFILGDTMAIQIKTSSRENDPYVLPSNNKELQAFISKYKVDMTEQVVSSIEFAVKHKLPIIEIFQFKDSKFVVTVSPKEFDANLENIYNYYLDMERYELCGRVAKLRDKLKNKLNEKTKKPTTGSK
jgi:hypothetical protein